MELRKYQTEALDAIDKALKEGLVRPAVVLPTGAGKTVVFSHGATRYLSQNPGRRVLVLAHTTELIDQAVRKLKAAVRAFGLKVTVGVVKAHHDDVAADIVVGSVQTLRSQERRNRIRNVGMVIVDECHHATASTYRAILDHYGCLTGGTPAIGYTATLARGDDAKLSEVWEDVAFSRDILFMIRQGYLVDVRGKRLEVPQLHLDGVRTSGGDFSDGDLGRALMASMAPDVVAAGYIEHAKDRKGLLFAPTVASAEAFAAALNRAGIVTEVVHGGLHRDVRAAVLRRLASGETQVVANCQVLTEGFDEPSVSCVVIARPTKSGPLFQQMVGRGLRVDPVLPYDGQDCLLLDVTGASRKHDLQSLIDLSEVKPREGQSLMEAVKEAEEGAEAQPDMKPVFRGTAAVVDFDPLARDSRWKWFKTTTGIMFLPAGTEEYVFLAPGENPGEFDVAWCNNPKSGSGIKPTGGFTEQGLELGYAMSAAEQLVIRRAGTAAANLGRKNRSWMAQPPSEAQLRTCHQFGIQVPASATKGDVADLMTTRFASNRINQIVRAIEAGRAKKMGVAA